MASNGYPQQGETATSHHATISGGQTTGGTPQPPDQVGWYFVEQYYTTLNHNPDQVGLFYSKRSSLVWGNEGEVLPMVEGRHDISERIKSLNLKNCKVRVTNVDSQASADNGILIQVMGEMSSDNCPNRRFVQTFFLAVQTNGYYVLNDIFRYLKEDEDIFFEESIEEELPQTTEEVADSEPDPTPVEETPVEEPVKDIEEPSVPAEPELEPAPTKLEEPITIAPAVPEIPIAVPASVEITNGTADVEEAGPEIPAEESEAVPEAVEETVSAPPTQPAFIEESIPVTPPQPSPVATPPPQQAVVEKPPAPVAPQSWARLVASQLGSSGPAKPPVPLSVSPSTQVPQTKSASQQTQATHPTPTTPVTSPTSSPGGWKNVSNNSKHHKPNMMQGAGDVQAQAYIKNVYENVDIESLKDALSKFGPIKAFEPYKLKNVAIVEFESVTSARTAKLNSPLRIGDQTVIIDERKPGGIRHPSNRSPSTGQRVGDTRQGQGQGRGPYPRTDRFDGRGGRDGGRGGTRGGSGRGFHSRRGGTPYGNELS